MVLFLQNCVEIRLISPRLALVFVRRILQILTPMELKLQGIFKLGARPAAKRK